MTAIARKTVLVPLDFSTDSLRALDAARQLVEPGGAVHVVHVVPAALVGVVAAPTSPVEHLARGREHLQKFLSDAKASNVDLHVVEGDPGHEIVKLAEKLHADLIVMPSHGRTGIAHILIGSVAERVVRLAHCPVLVLRSRP